MIEGEGCSMKMSEGDCLDFPFRAAGSGPKIASALDTSFEVMGISIIEPEEIKSISPPSEGKPS